MNDNKRLQDCIDNYEEYVARLATFPDKELAVKLELIHLQSEIAYKNNISSSIELLEIWRRQVIEARILKAENNIPDAPNEIDLALADVEFITDKAEQRKEILENYIEPEKESAPVEKIQNDNYTQLSLF
jgi:hypothetical protein